MTHSQLNTKLRSPRADTERVVYSIIATSAMALLTVVFLDRPIADHISSLRGDQIAPRWPFPLVDAALGLSLLCLAGVAVRGLVNAHSPFRWSIWIIASWTIVLTEAMGIALKRVFGRTWPGSSANEAYPTYLFDGVFEFSPFHGGRGWEAFPSGNAAMIGAIAAIFWLHSTNNLNRRLIVTGALLLLALLIIRDTAGSIHWVSDQLGGLAAGMFASLISAQMMKDRIPPPK